jgi:hypothetical protein
MSALTRFASAVLVMIVVLAGAVAPVDAGRGGRGGHGGFRHHRHHGHGFVGVDPWWWWWPPYYYNPYYWPYDWPYDWPPVVVEQPPIYVQQPAAAAAQAGSYWYYCPSAKGYYPGVPTCLEEWIKVPPRSE